MLRFAGGRESRPTFPLPASASASVASPPPAGEPSASSCPSPPPPRVFVLHQPDLTSISSPRSVVRRSRSHRRPIAPPLKRARRLPRSGIRRSSRFRTPAGAGEKHAPPPPPLSDSRSSAIPARSQLLIGGTEGLRFRPGAVRSATDVRIWGRGFGREGCAVNCSWSTYHFCEFWP